ncbi:L-serine ammonia-lyase, iron-sulfur-dependent, subunit alpha [Faecalicatena contorta]|uniref:L-serine ammonia-lyase n=1 Tax=Faecalicatena contorta TaxID=39482 RepID=A0A315ZWJ5_9FIRM|nr:L-serine ammonia-lyase, iron-sulfur-dependent, subunit alpha [Faecalicatena contorta]PWJ49238.1 L-serine dehydratase [Faecalicatena contorta]SUQ14943.1 L-serine dehydratase [Faecalicatena contorta]
MKKLPCSIFNDVIGPVMRGPSSSHVAGGARIAELVRQSFQAPLKKVVCDFDPTGSLAASHTGHGTDMGFACGLMGMDLSSPDVDQYESLAKKAGIDIEYRILEYGAVHPGNYRIHAEAADGSTHNWEAVSVGGGMIEMQKFDGFTVKICGDFYELLVVVDLNEKPLDAWKEELVKGPPAYEFCLAEELPGKALINIKAAQRLKNEMCTTLRAAEGILDVVYLEPILPTHSSADCNVPFLNAEQLLEYAKENRMPAWEYAVLFESKRGGISGQEVVDKMEAILTVMENAVDLGLAGTSYEDRILGQQAYKIDEQKAKGRLVPCNLLNSVIKSITAVMEVKSSMGLIVAAPTVGSCGCLPGTVIGLGRDMKLSREEMVRGLMVGGLIGLFIAEAATFSAEVAGCQVECGAASGMAAAAVTQMMGGTIEQCMDAASMALQNITGLACDPVANRVEVPCLGKNVMGGSNAIASANMILAGYDAVIPLDETISAIYEIGLSLPLELRCTFGGLGKTKTSVRMLENQK